MSKPEYELPNHNWSGFTSATLGVIRAGASLLVDQILEQAKANEIPEAQLKDAAATMLEACMVSFEIDDLMGDPHPPMNVFALTARLIANGTYADEVAKVAVDTEGKLYVPGEDKAA